MKKTTSEIKDYERESPYPRDISSISHTGYQETVFNGHKSRSVCTHLNVMENSEMMERLNIRHNCIINVYR